MGTFDAALRVAVWRGAFVPVEILPLRMEVKNAEDKDEPWGRQAVQNHRFG